ncbi:ABC transporter permease [Adlercreutzia mucosicola]|uniref:ABC transporter permease n=1 Tax=Adlercreutzia mucosicola TaxID=580026 RepID=UPI0003FE3B49|nr:ABC transporter permease [Adlercreutzia mucosicola]MCR2033890.1 ABC transporter permease [Adlercreutzia mucosicola]
MYLKLALRNIRRSVRDYAIYFITLLFGVAVFYAFNSIGSQQILFDMESSASASVFESTTQLLGMFSVVVACVLGFLILYANQFLIRRRKREFGTYLVLGMTPGHVSRIVLYETVLVGLISLAVGLICGVLLSQALSFFTAALFGTTMSNYQFVFSPDALVVTLACFAAIYVVVALFNTFTVSRCKLIDLIRAGERNERAGVRNPWACLVVFVAAIAVLAYAYQQLIANGLVMLDQPEFVRATIAMLVGSLMFFWSLAGFAIAVLTRLRGVYLRKLNLFTVRQIASKVNTAFLSLWAVCVLLFFSITVFSSGMGFVEVFVGGVEKANPYSATLSAGVWYGPDGTAGSSAGERERRAEMEADAPDRLALAEEYDWDMAAALEAGAPELWAETIGAWAQVSMWSLPDMTYDPIIDAAETVASPEAMRIDDLGKVRDTAVAVMSLSDFNAARTLQGQPAVNLEPGTCGLVNNMEIVNALAEAVAKAAPTITVADQELTVAGPIYDTQLEDNAMAATALIFVVPDEAVEALGAEGLIPTTQTLNVMYADNGKTAAENDTALGDIVAATQPSDMGGFEQGRSGAGNAYANLLWPVTRIITAHEMTDQSAGMRLMITYLALYIGFIFLVSTAAILAIQQLSQASDSAPRYRILSKLGCDAGMIYRSLLIQVLVYFLVPLALAVCHAACAIGVLSDSMFDAIGVSTFTPIMMAAGLTIVIYGGYMLVTYLAARGIAKTALTEG